MLKKSMIINIVKESYIYIKLRLARFGCKALFWEPSAFSLAFMESPKQGEHTTLPPHEAMTTKMEMIKSVTA